MTIENVKGSTKLNIKTLGDFREQTADLADDTELEIWYDFHTYGVKRACNFEHQAAHNKITLLFDSIIEFDS